MPDEDGPDGAIEIVLYDHSKLFSDAAEAANAPLKQMSEAIEASTAGVNEALATIGAAANFQTYVPSIRFKTVQVGNSEPTTPPIPSAEAPCSLGATTARAVDTPEPPPSSEPVVTGYRTVSLEVPVQPSVASGAPRAETNSQDRRNSALLKDANGGWLRVVNSELARRYGGISARGLRKAVSKDKIDTEGERQQKRFLVESLLRYFPPEK